MDMLAQENPGTVTRRGDDVFEIIGAWTIAHAAAIEKTLKSVASPSGGTVSISCKNIDALDTSGVWLLLQLRQIWMREGLKVSFTHVKPDHKILLEAINEAATAMANADDHTEKSENLFAQAIDFIGKGVADAQRITSLLGALMVAFMRRLWGLFCGIIGRESEYAAEFRVASVLTHVTRTGLSAVPIIMLMSFLIGGIVAQQAAYQLSFYGADIMAVDMVSVLVTRDMGVLLTAIMVAGRSGSAYTAEIGSMKMREEIDALKVIGLDPVDILLFPRIVGLIIALPFLTIIADYASLLGAQLALWFYIDLSWEIFLQRARDATPISYFLIGIIKAPFMALIIGLIAMSEGLRVAGSAESLSHRTTVAVVKAIFMVIVVDGVFAVISASLGV